MMTRFSGLRLFTVAAFCLFAPVVAAFAQGAASLFPDPIVATGKGIEIKRSAVENAFYTEKTLVLQQQNVAIPDSERRRVESDILLHLVVDKILVQRATAEEKTKTQDEVNKYLDDLRKAAPSETIFQQQIAATGNTLDQVKSAYLEKKLARVVLTRELVPSNAVSDAAVKQFYEDPNNATNFAVPEVVRVSHILLCTIDLETRRPFPDEKQKEKEKLARDILARAEKGEDFAALVRQYSDDIGTRDKDGEHTFARHGLGPGMNGFEVTSFSLKTNQISDLVETPYGYEIIKLLEKRPPSKVPFDDNVAAGIKEYLTNQEINRQLPAYIPKIEAEYSVKFPDTNYSPTPLLSPVALTNSAPPIGPGP